MELYDLTEIKTYKNKKIMNTLKEMTEHELRAILDSSILEFISSLDKEIVHYIFRNSNATMQNILWENDTIQRILILNTKPSEKFIYSKETIRALEKLNKEIKSQAIRKKIYHNEYFLSIIMMENRIENRFFYSYNLQKVFEGMTSSIEFNKLPLEKQFALIIKLNSHTPEILLPHNFRTKYQSIERILCECDVTRLSENILQQLTEEEKFLVDYLKVSPKDEDLIKEYIRNNLIEKGLSIDSLFKKIKHKEFLIKLYEQKHYTKAIPREKLNRRVMDVLLFEIEEEEIKEQFLQFILVQIMKESKVDKNQVYEALKRDLNNKQLSYNDIYYLSMERDATDKDRKLLFYLKFNIVLHNTHYLHGITTDQLAKINVKHINKFLLFLKDSTQDELSAIYGTAIKSYLIFGYERGLEILNKKYGEYDKISSDGKSDKIFLDNVSKTDVSRVEMRKEGKKYLPVIDRRFINFMFAKPMENHFINMLKEKKKVLYKYWYYLYNNYDSILQKCHNEITLKKVSIILEIEKYGVDLEKVTPDNYALKEEVFLENITLGNRTKYSNNEVFEEIIKIYDKMKQRRESSIPYVEGRTDYGYKYQMMRLDDHRIFEIGYRANCCIRTLDIAHKHLLHAALCRNGRILFIYNEEGSLAAFSPLKRNGNVLIANSIECIDKSSENRNRIAEAFREGMNEIVRITKESKEPIHLVGIGEEAYLKPKTIPFPNEFQTPTIFEKQDEIYKDTDEYHKKLEIVYMDNNFDLKDIKSKDPETSYMDPREEVQYIDFSINQETQEGINAINRINAINYATSEEYVPMNRYMLKDAYYTKDWYIATTQEGIIGAYLEQEEAKEEYESYRNRISKKEPKKVLAKTITPKLENNSNK